MFEPLEKLVLTGVGMALLTRDKVEEWAREIAKSANLSAEKGQKFVDEAVARAKKGRQEFDAAVQRAVDEAIRRTRLATREDLAEMAARIDRLEQKLAAGASPH